VVEGARGLASKGPPPEAAEASSTLPI